MEPSFNLSVSAMILSTFRHTSIQVLHSVSTDTTRYLYCWAGVGDWVPYWASWESPLVERNALWLLLMGPLGTTKAGKPHHCYVVANILTSYDTTPPGEEGSVVRTGGGESPGCPRGLSWWCCGRRGLPTAREGWKIPACFSDTLCGGFGMPPDILARVKVQPAPALAFAGTGVGGSLLFLRCLAGIEQLGSKHFLSCWTAPFLVPWLERVGLSWGFFICPCGCFQIAGLLCSKFRIYYMKQANRKPQGTHHLIVPWVSRSLASLPSSLQLLECSYVWFMDNVQGS